MKNTSKSAVSFQPNKSIASQKSQKKDKEPALSTMTKENNDLPSVNDSKTIQPEFESKYHIDKIKKRKKEKSIEEEIMSKEISSLEKTRLNRVFEILCGEKLQKNDFEFKDKSKNGEIEKNKDIDQEIACFTAKDVSRVLISLDYPLNKHEIDLMIWEVDENLDQCVDRYEFDLMYKRCIFDKTGLEPKQLFYLVEFLMYDKNERHVITIEDTLELLYVKTKSYNKNPREDENSYNKITWEDEIKSIFGEDNKTEDGKEVEINYKQFLESQMHKSIALLKSKEKEKKLQKPLKKSEENL